MKKGFNSENLKKLLYFYTKSLFSQKCVKIYTQWLQICIILFNCLSVYLHYTSSLKICNDRDHVLRTDYVFLCRYYVVIIISFKWLKQPWNVHCFTVQQMVRSYDTVQMQSVLIWFSALNLWPADHVIPAYLQQKIQKTLFQ